MNENPQPGPFVLSLPLAQKRRFLLGLSEEQCRELLSAGGEREFEEIGDRTGLDADQIRHLVSDPQSLMGLRLNPNQLRREQLKQPSLTPVQIDAILQGKPYYTLAELASVTHLSLQTLQDLFEIEPYRFSDPITGREVSLSPVFGRYILPPSDLEPDPALAAGYADVYTSTVQVGLRVVEAIDFEAEQRPHELKREFKGRVYPVMRDGEGFERYLVPGAVDVWFEKSTPEARRDEILQELQVRVTESVPEVGYYRTQLTLIPQNDDAIHTALNTIAQAIQQHEVLFAEPDQLGFEDYGPDLDVEQGEDEFEALERYWNQIAIDLAGAHAINSGSSDVTVFVIDSGCRMDHDTLEPGFRPDWESLDLSFDLGEAPEAASPNETAVSHGTKVAGVVRQVAPGCRILPVKIPGNAGGPAAPGYGLRAAAILKALDYLAAGRHAVMNLSWKTNGQHIGIREALRSAEARGLVLVTSAGNYSPTASQQSDKLHYPSAHSYLAPMNRTLLSVAALGPGDVKASYSYYGAQSVTVSAPGGEPGGLGSGVYTATTSTPASHTYVAGTSFAAPHVAGLAALLFSAQPALSAEQVLVHIKDTADNVDAANAGFKGWLGAGRINARAALEQVGGPVPTHTITTTSGAHGAVVPSGAVAVPEGGSRRFEFVPDPGYAVADVRVDGNSIGTPDSHTLTGVSTDHTVVVTFAQGATTGDLVNINTATAAMLEALPHIGSWMANQIVSYRQDHGPYGSIKDLVAVGMSDWAINQIASLITV